jgi:CPA2 family monovalent cation:H+ antiporter-2
MFAALFFVSIGALMDISMLPMFIAPALILIATSFGAKFATVYFSSKLMGVGKRTSAKAGFALSASGGELALVTAKGGADVGATSAFILPMVGAMTIITTFLSPYVIKMGWKYAKRIKAEDGEEEPGVAAQAKEEKDDAPHKP